MFLCECHSCGRRELRGPRSLVTTPFGATATCRACGSAVLVGFGRRRPQEATSSPAPQLAPPPAAEAPPLRSTPRRISAAA